MLMSPDFTIYTCRRSGAKIVAAIGQLEVNIIVQKYICASAPTDWWGGARSPLPKTPPASAHHLPSPGKNPADAHAFGSATPHPHSRGVAVYIHELQLLKMQ